MIPPVEAIKRVLWGNLELDGKLVPVIKRSYPYDKTPCVTIDDSSPSGFVNRLIITENFPVNESHPLFDENNPLKKYPQQVLREIHQVTININAWSDSVDEQEKLNNNILRLFHLAQSDFYLFCSNYNKGYCKSMNHTCFAKELYESNSGDLRGVKGQCPKPFDYGYENIFLRYNLYRDSFMVEQPFNLDDKSKDEIVYRSVVKLSTGYYTDHIIGGLVSDKIIFKDEDIL